MPITPLKAGQPWTPSEIAQLRQFALENLPVPLIARQLWRSEGAVRDTAKRHAIQLKPHKRARVDQSLRRSFTR